jgi:putative endonuclease
MAIVYILYAPSIDSYYIGSCKDLDLRLQEHASNKHKRSFTAKADDWKLVFKIENLDYGQARKIESHIKRMKSRKYINDLTQYPDMANKLKLRYG